MQVITVIKPCFNDLSTLTLLNRFALFELEPHARRAPTGNKRIMPMSPIATVGFTFRAYVHPLRQLPAVCLAVFIFRIAVVTGEDESRPIPARRPAGVFMSSTCDKRARLESCPLPVVVATNIRSALDPAPKRLRGRNTPHVIKKTFCRHKIGGVLEFFTPATFLDRFAGILRCGSCGGDHIARHGTMQTRRFC